METPQTAQNGTQPNCGEELGGLPEVLTVEEVAKLLRVNRKTVYDAAQRGEIPGRKIGRILRFSREAVVQWLRGQGRVPTPRGRP